MAAAALPLRTNKKSGAQSPANTPALLRLLPLLLCYGPACAGAIASLHAPTLLQVQVVTRHGAREELPKAAADLAEGGPPLTVAGELQLTDLGAQLRAAYLTTGAPLGLPGLANYSAADAWLLSSAPDRAVTSAMSLADGLWPAGEARGGRLQVRDGIQGYESENSSRHHCSDPS
mmetsp:Transcript_32114/g.80409  ORF Transcript_32114/g.80409 Transcript_32114/m.80409 type:complete len:175 (-) Transcript_32114:530-1054(-)